jgi:fructosamine-3-kinase
MWTDLEDQISRASQRSFRIAERQSVSGGCINQGYRLVGHDDRCWFVKLNRASDIGMFEAEALALDQLAATRTIRVPQPLCHGIAGSQSFLVMEWLDLGGYAPTAWTTMGRQLAQMHRTALSPQGYGWQRNNTIGSTPQLNDWSDDWPRFWRDRRLGYQFKLARRNGGHFPKAEDLLQQVPDLLTGHNPDPSLVHGDLWSGNAALSRDGTPVLLDPASYYGDREVDLAMTELFGGFPASFYTGYQSVWPLEAGYAQRKLLYNLYHVLNHFNLFGGSYANQAKQIIQQLLH